MHRSEPILVARALQSLASNAYVVIFKGKYPTVWSPDGKWLTLLIQVSAKPNEENGRHLFGIAEAHLDSKDFYVFFAGDEDTFLLVPTSFLRKALNKDRAEMKIVKGQWHVNIFYDWGGGHQLQPVSWGPRPLPKIPLSTFALPVD